MPTIMGEIAILIPFFGMTIGLIAVLGGFWTAHQKMKLKMIEAQGGAVAAANQATQAELEKLRDRVAVLERLITDEDHRLAGEIERLRREDARG
jgi:hypothetical protein